MVRIPTHEDYLSETARLRQRVLLTPVVPWTSSVKSKIVGSSTKVSFKLELLQHTGSFKVRGALTVVDGLSEEERACGVVAGTGGNHGIAVAYAAKQAGISAHIIAPKSINPFRLKAIEELGAQVSFVEDISMVLDEMLRVAAATGATVMHPFENPKITLGAGTLGVEFLQQVPDLDAIVVPIGGGGLASGVAAAVKQLKPECAVYGVEPAGANSMNLSIDAGHPVVLEAGPKSIADSLSSPKAEPYSFAVCQKYIDDVVLIDDVEMIEAMKLLFGELKLAVEPAGAAATAGLLGPLKERVQGKSVGVVVCGSNIDLESFYRMVSSEKSCR